MLAQFATLLETRIGLDTDVIGMQAIARAVSVRQMACGLNDTHAYWEHVNRSNEELQELIEEIIVPETWFFREDAALSALVQVVHQRIAHNRSHRVVSALSLPCATGEEPYSMAMALLDAGLPSNSFHIDGIDISAQALEKARTAVYGRNAFRGKEVRFRDKYFTETEQGYRLAADVAVTVTFKHGNIFDDSTLPVRQYDVIFLRNVLIYFGPAQRARAISTALRLLKDDGCLFVGTAEASLLRAHGLVPIGMPKACGYQRAKEGAAVLPRFPSKEKTARSSLSSLSAKPRAVRAAPKEPVLQPPQPVHGSGAMAHASSEEEGLASTAVLDEAAVLADQGQLDRASALCEQYLESHGPSTQVLNLLGLIQDARGQWKLAADFYRKVLYLDPHHAEALVHLAALLDKQGHAAEAVRLRRRYERISTRSEK